MFDGNPNTGWAIKLSKAIYDDDALWGPLMNINAKKVDHINILNGYGKNQDSFNKNTRAAWICIYRINDDVDFEHPEVEDILYEGPLKDTIHPQTLQVSNLFDNSRPTGLVQLIFQSYIPGSRNGGGGYYMGSKWDDLVISELEFYGIPK